jgi:glycosyltransferase involved in cell wall biosynthesis
MILRRNPIANVAINLAPRKGSWGGANQWATQVTRYLEYCGYRVRHDLRQPVDLIVMTHTGLSEGTSFLHRDVEAFRRKHPGVRCIHRINDNDIRKGTGEMDQLLAEANEMADHTVFVSRWLLDHHASKWFDRSRPHSVIEPGADPAVFHPVGSGTTGPLCRVVTHHWSKHWSKGFDVYQQIDEAIADGRLPGFELVVIGRWPDELHWKSAVTLPPSSGHELAAHLRSCHLYVSASRHEPGAMHVVEGLQCGLPLLYHRDSGGTVEIGQRLGLEITDDIADSLLEARKRLPELRNHLLKSPPSGDLMSLEYRRLIQRLLSCAQ